MKRLAFIASLLLPLPVFAAPICDGRYQDAAEMVDAAFSPFDTLYSGGNHWHRLDNVGSTLDLYRLWRGLADQKLRKIDYIDHGFDSHLEADSAAEIVTQALDAAETQQSQGLSEAEKYKLATNLDLATSVARPADWWRHPDQAENLSDVQRMVATLAPERPLLDWLQTVQAASNTPWSMAWQLDDGSDTHDAEYDRLIADALDKYRSGQGIEWAVAAQLFWHPGSLHDGELAKLNQDFGDRVMNCQASAAEYAAFAAGESSAGRSDHVTGDRARFQALPVSIQSLLIRNTAMRVMAQGDTVEAGRALEDLAALTTDSRLLSWLNVARTYLASSVQQLIAIHRGTGSNDKSMRAFSLLAADDLHAMAMSGVLAANDEILLLKTAYTRLFALGRQNEALAVLKRLQKKLIGKWQSTPLGSLEPSLPVRVSMALQIARTPHLSMSGLDAGYYGRSLYDDVGIILYNQHVGREIPMDFTPEYDLQGDFETWLLAPWKWYRFRHMRGYSWEAIERYEHSRDRDHSIPDMTVPRAFPPSPQSSPYGFTGLIARDEINHLKTDRRLVRQVSLVLLNWADTASAKWWQRTLSLKSAFAAEALHRVVMLNRYESGGDLNGTPLGKRAFTLLHKRFPKSEWTKKTPYWYDGRKEETD